MDDSQLLRLQSVHRTSSLTDDPFTCRHHHLTNYHEEIEELLHITGFLALSGIKSFKIDPALITALVERWRPETHTFHLPSGECTITLQDVEIQLGIQVKGEPVTGATYFDWSDICQELLGKVPDEKKDMRGCELKIKWLVDNFNKQQPPVTDLEVDQYCRAHILIMIGSVLMPDKSNNRVHLMYLPRLRDLNLVKAYSWGSACLAHLYKELCRASHINAKSIGGCLLLLQSWAWYRLPMFKPSPSAGIAMPYWPYASRWSVFKKDFSSFPHGNLEGIRSRIDHMRSDEFEWLVYSPYMDQILALVKHSTKIWKSCVPLICFSTVEWHQIDRVKLQFGLLQEIPEAPKNIDELHNLDKRGNKDANWGHYHAEWVNLWGDRKNRILQGQSLTGLPIHTNEYWNWYRSNSRPFLSFELLLNDPRSRSIEEFTPYPSSFQLHYSCDDTPSPIVVKGIFDEETGTSCHFIDVATPHSGSKNVRHSFVSLENHYQWSNIFGVTADAPDSAITCMRQVSFQRQLSSHQQMDAPGSSSLAPGRSSIHVHGHQEEEQHVEEPHVEEPPDTHAPIVPPDTEAPIDPLGRRRNPRRNPKPRDCGTGRHLGH